MPIILSATLATAAACAVLSVWMAVRITQIRRGRKIFVGDGGDTALVARMRAQANFVEYAPFVLILLALLELARGPSLWAWGYGLVFVIGRICHVFGMDGWRLGRQIGALTTLVILLLLAGECIWVAASAPYGTAPIIVDVPRAG
ncbi:MAG TPA: MAPEG family protein [Sphingomonas sp.]|nr:MAPEG family protein [Sphingomonas sp.]